jgi:hypothetical protein
MGSMINCRLAKLERERLAANNEQQKVHLLTEDVDIDAMIASGAAGADDFFIVMVMKDPAPSNQRALS